EPNPSVAQLERDRLNNAVRSNVRRRHFELDFGLFPRLTAVVGIEHTRAESPHIGKGIEALASVAPHAFREVSKWQYDAPALELNDRQHRAVVALAYQNGLFPILTPIFRANVVDVISHLV